jgi:hypothetical protein
MIMKAFAVLAVLAYILIFYLLYLSLQTHEKVSYINEQLQLLELIDEN